MKKKLYLLAFLSTAVVTLAGCGAPKPILIWVGTESEEFYVSAMEEYIANWEEENGTEFPNEIRVVGTDATAAAKFVQDPEAGADILQIPHDNLGKLTAGSSVIGPITDQILLDSIYENSPDSFHNVIKATVGGTEYTFGVPIIAQSLVLYYNTEFVSETQVQTWEGLLEAAQQASSGNDQKQAMMLVGEDGFNNSFLLLGMDAETKATSLRLYEDKDINDNYALGDDTVARLKWGQRFFTDPNGGARPSSSGWQVALKDELVLSTISGAWNGNAVRTALGSNFGVARLPRFTITEADAYGEVASGTVMQSGTFADTKMLVMKKNSPYAEYLQDILKYLSSPEIQEQSFIEAENLPAYKNAAEEFESMATNELAKKQIEMFEYGRPQPFGADALFNFYYYSKGAPALLMEILINQDDDKPKDGTGDFGTDEAILAQLQKIQNIWITGRV
jgi:arabinogalactan oligomer/maltooligosaccharide transport system substrate-binding protein